MVKVSRMQRGYWIVFGAFAQLLFLPTVWNLYWFLKGPTELVEHDGLWIDVVLALQFAIPHSVLLLPGVKRILERWVPASLYGSFFCIVTCVSLLITIINWRTSAETVWQLVGWQSQLVVILFVGTWGALVYSLSLTGLGYQTGWTTWLQWLKKQPQLPRRFEPRGAYRFLRHPVYLSFLGLLWLTPQMTVDRLLLAVIWSVYILVGSCLKDRRLSFYVGQVYLDYQARVPGFPAMPLGPLARIARSSNGPLPSVLHR